MNWASTEAPEEEEDGIVVVESHKLKCPSKNDPSTEKKDPGPAVASPVTVVTQVVAIKSPERPKKTRSKSRQSDESVRRRRAREESRGIRQTESETRAKEPKKN